MPSLIVVAAIGGWPALLVPAVVVVVDVHIEAFTGRPGPVRRLIAVVGSVAGRLLTTTTTVLLWAVVFLPVAVLVRLVRLLPWMGPSRHRRPSSWAVRSPGRSLSDHTYLDERSTATASPATRPRRWGLRAARIGTVGIPLLAVLVVLRVASVGPFDRPIKVTKVNDYDTVGSVALRDQPHADEAITQTQDAWVANRYRPFVGWYMPDHHSAYANITNGERLSYQQPPLPAGRPLEVWFFGGSALFGFGARDRFTIPSAFAKAAQRAGVPVRVHNFGIPAYTSYQESLLFDASLADRPSPDLVIFYDGFNDAGLNLSKAYFEDTALKDPTDAFAADARQAYNGLSGNLDAAGREVRRASTADRPRTLPSPDDQIDAMMASYRRGLDLSRSVAARANVPMLTFWQPCYFSKATPDSDDAAKREGFGWDDFLLRSWRDLWQVRIPNRMPQGVVDLSGVLDHEPGSVFYDFVHTNEHGDQVIGDVIFDRAEAQLRADLVAGPSGG